MGHEDRVTSTIISLFFSSPSAPRLPATSPFLPHSLFVVYIFTVKWNYDQRVCGYVLCVLTLVTHQWVEFWSAWSAADSKASQAEGAAKNWGLGGGVGGGTESENRKHGKEREICTLVPGSFLLLSLPLSLLPFLFLSVSLEACQLEPRLPPRELEGRGCACRGGRVTDREKRRWERGRVTGGLNNEVM